MSEVKPHLSYEGQIDKLRERGCIIDNASFCRDVLVNIGYYRLSAYFLPFKNADGNYIDNLSFERVYRVYEFDRKHNNIPSILSTQLLHYTIIRDHCSPYTSSPLSQNKSLAEARLSLSVFLRFKESIRLVVTA